MQKIIFICSFLLIGFCLQAQELNCSVTVNAPSIQGTNRQVLETLQTSIREFMNNQRWTDHVFKVEERIECSVMITINTMTGSDEFDATIQVQARRPIFGTSYNSVMFNYLDDKFHFKYVEFESLNYNPNTLDSNLVGVLAFYAFYIVGLDYESFSPEGGSPYLKNAEGIVMRAQSIGEKGWTAFESNTNRYWLVTNLMDEYHRQFRTAFYNYHRLGLDMLATKPDQARIAIVDCLTMMQKVYRLKPGSFILKVFFDAKSEEIANIFSESNVVEKDKVYAILQELDPTNLRKYQSLKSND